jgi:hypothetical protein
MQSSQTCPGIQNNFRDSGILSRGGPRSFQLGALGYVVKAHAGGEPLAAVEAALSGQQFVTST